MSCARSEPMPPVKTWCVEGEIVVDAMERAGDGVVSVAVGVR